MSMTQEGPDWWQAWDRRWYPPEQRPADTTLPPPPGEASKTPPRSYSARPIPSAANEQVMTQTTSGLAVASLVLSILWLFGVGSILAIIFSVGARRDIRQSRGRVTGDGLAIAGLVIGIVSLVMTVFFFSTFFVADHALHQLQFPSVITQTTQPLTILRMGESGPPQASLGGGRITVYSLQVGVKSEDPTMPGSNFAVINLKECAGPNGTRQPAQGVSINALQLETPNGEVSTQIRYPHFVRRPNFPYVGNVNLKPNQCVRGLVGYSMSGTSVLAVAWNGGTNDDYQWALSGAS